MPSTYTVCERLKEPTTPPRKGWQKPLRHWTKEQQLQRSDNGTKTKLVSWEMNRPTSVWEKSPQNISQAVSWILALDCTISRLPTAFGPCHEKYLDLCPRKLWITISVVWGYLSLVHDFQTGSGDNASFCFQRDLQICPKWNFVEN